MIDLLTATALEDQMHSLATMKSWVVESCHLSSFDLDPFILFLLSMSCLLQEVPCAVQRVAGILAGVQAQVAKEAVVWKTGPLVMAPLVKTSLGAAQVMIESYCSPFLTQVAHDYCTHLMMIIPSFADCHIMTLVPASHVCETSCSELMVAIQTSYLGHALKRIGHSPKRT